MREYFCAYHSMLDATRKLSDAEVGRLFRGLLHYSATGEQPDNLQGREEIVFDIFSQQIDREVEKYNDACVRNRQNITSRYQSLRPVTSGYDPKQEKEKDKDKEEEKDKEKDKEKRGSIRAQVRFTPPTVDEVEAYAKEKGYKGFSAQRFVDFYASKGWMVGKSPMKDWRAAVRGWASRDNEPRQIAPKDNPAHNYEQREYKDEDFGDDFFIDLDKYGEV